MNCLLVKGNFVIFCNLSFITPQNSKFLFCSRHVGRGNFDGAFIHKAFVIQLINYKRNKHSLCTITGYLFDITNSNIFIVGDSKTLNLNFIQIIMSVPPRRYPYLDVVVELVWSHDPESYAGGSVCYWSGIPCQTCQE
jgi:hypothetical protein